jgi:hypothetical protein
MSRREFLGSRTVDLRRGAFGKAELIMSEGVVAKCLGFSWIGAHFRIGGVVLVSPGLSRKMDEFTEIPIVFTLCHDR